MTYLYPAIILNKDELKALSIDIKFKNGYIIDNDLSIQKQLEDNYKVPIVSIQKSTRLLSCMTRTVLSKPIH